MDDKLTPEQVKNWRQMLPILFGLPPSYGTDEDVQRLRDRFQAETNKHND